MKSSHQYVELAKIHRAERNFEIFFSLGFRFASFLSLWWIFCSFISINFGSVAHRIKVLATGTAISFLIEKRLDQVQYNHKNDGTVAPPGSESEQSHSVFW
jgi:hypothetical protein